MNNLSSAGRLSQEDS
jgi:hypothetical protein